VDALLALVAEGDGKASPERIVERAGVSIRTLWTNFKDLEGLYAAANERLMERQREHYRPIALTLVLPERIRAFCEQRARMLEIAAPAARATQVRLPTSAQLRHNVAAFRIRARDELELVFAEELATVTGEDRELLVLALLANTTWSAWAMLRDECELGVDEATAVMVRAVAALLSYASYVDTPAQR
jgi:AcrR family transcriptional regulator